MTSFIRQIIGFRKGDSICQHTSYGLQTLADERTFWRVRAKVKEQVTHDESILTGDSSLAFSGIYLPEGERYTGVLVCLWFSLKMPITARAYFPAIDLSTGDSSLAFLGIFFLSAALVICASLPLDREDECTNPAGYQNPEVRHCPNIRQNYR